MPKAKTFYAYCDARGVIRFGNSIPDGMLPVMNGSERKVRRTMCATARHAYDGKTLLVPGVPEAPNQIAGVDALTRFVNWLESRNAKKPSREARAA